MTALRLLVFRQQCQGVHGRPREGAKGRMFEIAVSSTGTAARVWQGLTCLRTHCCQGERFPMHAISLGTKCLNSFFSCAAHSINGPPKLNLEFHCYGEGPGLFSKRAFTVAVVSDIGVAVVVADYRVW